MWRKPCHVTFVGLWLPLAFELFPVSLVDPWVKEGSPLQALVPLGSVPAVDDHIAETGV